MIYILILLPTLYFLWPKRLTRIFSVLYAGLYPGEHLEKFDGVKLGFVPSLEDEKRDCFKEKRNFYILAQDETGKDCVDLQIFPEKNRSVFKLLFRRDGEEFSCSGPCQSTEEIISCGKLQVEVLEPCRRTRVSFSGLMNQETEFVKFNFFFQVLNCPINLDQGWVQFGSAVGTILKGSEEKEFHFRGVRGWSTRNQDEVEIISTLGGRIVLLSQDGAALFYPGKYGSELRRIKEDQYQDEEGRTVSFSRSQGKVQLDSEDTVKYSSNLSPPLLQEEVVKHEDDFDENAEIVTFQDAECLQKHLVGGKGCSLGTLSQSGFPVPPGLVLTTTLSSKLCRKNNVEISSALDDLERSGEQDSNNLEEICNKVVNQITGSGVTESILENLEMVGNSVFGDIWSEKLAVRSSGVDEDGLDTSCAGQNETILGVHGKNAILRSIEKCLASQYAYRSVLYRRQNGQPLVSNMAVVIQRMVPADSAGVLFTANPVTGNPLEYTVTASYGLGESVVSGQVDPDTVVVDMRDKPKVLSSSVGLKKERMVLREDTETDGSDEDDFVKLVQSDSSSKLCMETDTILKLASLGKEMVEVYGCPQDIEFAVSNLEIYILQARPITTLHRYTDWEISHEFDSPRPSEKEIWTKANLGEVVPGAMTPLTRSTLIQTMDRILQLNTSLKENNPRFYSSYSWSWIQTIQHHNVLDVINGVLRWPESNLSFVSKAVDYAVFGHEVTSQAMLDTALHRHGGRDDVTTNLNLIRDMLTHTKIHNLEKDKFDELEFLQQIQKLKCPKQILAKIDTQWNLLARITYIHIKNSELSSAYQTIVFLIISGGKEDLTPQILQEIADILTLDESTVESAGVPTGLNKLYAEIITKDDWKDGFAEASPEEAESWIKTNLSSSYRKFLDLFGHRCLKEFDLSVKPWREDSSPIIETLQSMLNTTRSQVPGQGKKEKKSCGFVQEKIINLILPLAHGSVARREESKSILIKLTDILRQAYSILADSLKFTGLLIASSDIFYLTHAELHQLVYKEKRSLVVKAGRRKKILPTLNELQFPEMIDFQTFDPSQVCDSSHVPVTEGNSLNGTPACSGTIKGLARVVTRLQDARSIQPGEILITTSTDIGWSPYFPMLGGVVTELGGLISHGAVVAREYGLPCLVGTCGATQFFKTGDMVLINTKLGKVFKVES